VAAVTILTLASERVSFTKVIESSPALSRLDALGRPQPSFRGDPVT
jgi:UDP-GlcNAc:undecaprenyl-phosphate GlcNAc-1-phosphate transferase